MEHNISQVLFTVPVHAVANVLLTCEHVTYLHSYRGIMRDLAAQSPAVPSTQLQEVASHTYIHMDSV